MSLRDEVLAEMNRPIVDDAPGYTRASQSRLEDLTMGHLSHRDLANKVRMLQRDDWQHEAVVVAARDRIAWMDAKIAHLRAVNTNHVDGFRGIRDMAKEGDLERIILWCDDSLSGYTETVETTIKQVSDERNALRGACTDMLESLKHAVAIIRKHVPEDALGMNSDGTEPFVRSWPLLDEYLHYMDEAIKKGDAALAPQAVPETAGRNPSSETDGQGNRCQLCGKPVEAGQQVHDGCADAENQRTASLF